MPFTSSLPTWNKTATAPTTTKQNTGWSAGEKPPASIFDWFFNTTYKALQELQAEAINIDQRGNANGVAPLDSLFRVPIGNLPTSDSITYNGVDKVATANSVKMAVDWVKGYGLGTKGKAVTDCNATISSGFYYVNPSSSNSPSANAGSLIVSGGDGSGFLSQMFIDFSIGTLYVRRQYSDNWQPWKEIATKEYVDKLPPWTSATLNNGWVDFGGNDAPMQYTKIGNVVFLKGVIKGGTTTSGTSILTLPSGYRPLQREYGTSLCSGNGVVRVVIFPTDGQVQIQGTSINNTWLQVDMCFIADGY